MSDTTDTLPAVTAPTAPTTPVGAAASPGAARVCARDLVHVAQGLYFIFWGVLVSVIVGTQIFAQSAVIGAGFLASVWLRLTADFLLVAGALATVAGSWRLTQARLDGLRPVELSRLWRRRARLVFWLAVLLGYFCVLFLLWRRAIHSLYLQTNALAFAVVGIGYLVVLSRAVAALAAGLGGHDLAAESRWFNVSNVGLLLLPFLAALAYLGVQAVRQGTNLVIEFNILLSQTNLLTGLVFVLPLSLTLSVVWAAKDMALQRLAQIDVVT